MDDTSRTRSHSVDQLDSVHREPTPAQTESAKLEEDQFSTGVAEVVRREKLKTVFAVCVRGLVVLLFALLVAALVVVAIHYLGPERMHWMQEGRLQTVVTFLFSGPIFMFLFLHVRDQLSTADRSR